VYNIFFLKRRGDKARGDGRWAMGEARLGDRARGDKAMGDGRREEFEILGLRMYDLQGTIAVYLFPHFLFLIFSFQFPFFLYPTLPQCLGLGFWFLELGTWFLEFGTWNLILPTPPSTPIPSNIHLPGEKY
jgi:hypothetical protein